MAGSDPLQLTRWHTHYVLFGLDELLGDDGPMSATRHYAPPALQVLAARHHYEAIGARDIFKAIAVTAQDDVPIETYRHVVGQGEPLLVD